MSHTDTFTRTTSFGLGTDGTFTYTWSTNDTGFGSASAATTHVDGSKVVIPDSNSNFDSYVWTPQVSHTGTVQYDFYLPALDDLSGSPNFLPSFILELIFTDINPVAGTDRHIMMGFEQDYVHNTTAHLNFGAWWGGGWAGIPSVSMPVDLGNYYTFKMSYDADAGRAGYKMWKTSDSEPTFYQIIWEPGATAIENFRINTGFYPDMASFLNFFYFGHNTSTPADAYLDNLATGTFDPPAFGFTADANIVVPSATPSFTADAVLSATKTGSLSADAYIIGQITLDAVIRAVHAGSLMADGLIVPHLFTADAVITNNGVLQHFRDRDHQGTLPDTMVVTTAAVGPYPAGTSLTTILADLASRV